MNYKIAVLPGDGIGPEVMREGIEVLKQVAKLYNFGIELEEGIVGGASIDAHGKPLVDSVLNQLWNPSRAGALYHYVAERCLDGRRSGKPHHA